MYVRSLDGTEYPLQATLTHDLELNGNRSLSAKIQSNKVNDAFIDEIDKMWEIVDDDDVSHKIIYLKKKGEGNSLTVDVKAIPLFFDEFDTDRIYETYNESMTAQECYGLIFAGTGFNCVIVDSFYAVQWEGFGKGATRLELFKNANNRYMAEFRLSGNTVYLEAQIGQDTSFMYRYKLNASNITMEADASQLWTYAKGFGDFADGDEANAKLLREYTSPLAAIIGKRHAPPIYDGRVTDPATMDSALKTLVDESLKISVSADLQDLRKQGYALAQPELGDRIFVIDERINYNDEVRAINISVTKDWQGNVLDLKVTFGTQGIAKRYQSDLKTAVDRITDIVEGRTTIPSNALDPWIVVVSKALQSAQTEVKFTENGILCIDKTNPNNVVLINSNGIGVSRDGGQTFKEAITSEGFVLSVGAIGQLETNNIKVGGGTGFEDGYSPDDIKTDANGYTDGIDQSLREDLRLASPLPTVLTLDSSGIKAVLVGDSTRYVILDGRGIFINKGAIQIQRSDGYNVMTDGILKNGFNLFGAYPAFKTPGAKEIGPWVQVATTNRFETIQSYTFRHDSRYILVAFGLYTDNNITGYMAYDLSDWTGQTDLGTLGTSTNSGPDSDGVYTYLLDLGTPTGDLKRLNIRLYGSDPNWGVYGRILYIAQEG